MYNTCIWKRGGLRCSIILISLIVYHHAPALMRKYTLVQKDGFGRAIPLKPRRQRYYKDIFLCFKIPASPTTTRVPRHPWATFSAAAEHGRIYKQLPLYFSFSPSPSGPRQAAPTHFMTTPPPTDYPPRWFSVLPQPCLPGLVVFSRARAYLQNNNIKRSVRADPIHIYRMILDSLVTEEIYCLSMIIMLVTENIVIFYILRVPTGFEV